MRQRILLLFAKTWTMTDEKTGEIKTGVSANFYFNLTMNPISGADGSVGTRPAKASMDVGRMVKCVIAPAFYDADFTMTVGSDGKPILKIIDLDYITSAKLTEIPRPEEKSGKAG